MSLTHEQRITRLEERCKSVDGRLHKIEDVHKSINEINLNIQELALTQKDMLETMRAEQDIRKSHGKRIDDLEKKPARDYDRVKWIILTALCSALVSGLVGWALGFLLK